MVDKMAVIDGRGRRARNGLQQNQSAPLRMRDLFASPEFFPLGIDPHRRLATFVRMTRETYADSVFLDLYRTRYVGNPITLRLDDVVLACGNSSAPKAKAHYILNTAYCCSTLLSNYFESLPNCLVLREPRLLAQVATMMDEEDPRWELFLDVCMKLLLRTYEPGQAVVIKSYEPSNRLAKTLLERDPNATATYLITPLRSFLLSVLKSEERREWARGRVASAARDAARYGVLGRISAEALTTPQAAAYIWLFNYSLFRTLKKNDGTGRVTLANGDALVEAPESTLRAVLSGSGLQVDDEQFQAMISTQSVQKYSKDADRPFDAASRHDQLNEINRCWGAEADEGMRWAESLGFSLQDLELERVENAVGANPAPTISACQEWTNGYVNE